MRDALQVAKPPAEGLCPVLEFNAEGGLKTLEQHLERGADGRVLLKLPQAPGVS